MMPVDFSFLEQAIKVCLVVIVLLVVLLVWSLLK